MNINKLVKEIIEQVNLGASEDEIIETLLDELQDAFFQGQDGRYIYFNEWLEAE